jgi:hypothetical protein
VVKKCPQERLAWSVEIMKWPVIFALLTAICWGMYGPALGKSREALHSPFKPYVAIGIAYLIWGVVGRIYGY